MVGQKQASRPQNNRDLIMSHRLKVHKQQFAGVLQPPNVMNEFLHNKAESGFLFTKLEKEAELSFLYSTKIDEPMSMNPKFQDLSFNASGMPNMKDSG